MIKIANCFMNWMNSSAACLPCNTQWHPQSVTLPPTHSPPALSSPSNPNSLMIPPVPPATNLGIFVYFSLYFISYNHVINKSCCFDFQNISQNGLLSSTANASAHLQSSLNKTTSNPPNVSMLSLWIILQEELK